GMAMMRYMVVVERGETSWGAHVPDLPGCLAVGETREEVLRLIREAIEFHIDGLKQDGLPVPPPSSAGEVVEGGAAELRHPADGLRPRRPKDFYIDEYPIDRDHWVEGFSTWRGGRRAPTPRAKGRSRVPPSTRHWSGRASSEVANLRRRGERAAQFDR